MCQSDLSQGDAGSESERAAEGEILLAAVQRDHADAPPADPAGVSTVRRVGEFTEASSVGDREVGRDDTHADFQTGVLSRLARRSTFSTSKDGGMSTNETLWITQAITERGKESRELVSWWATTPRLGMTALVEREHLSRMRASRFGTPGAKPISTDELSR